MSEKKTCDTLIKGIVISMDPKRHVYLNGFVAIENGLIKAVGPSNECNYDSDNILGGDDLSLIHI